MSTPCHFYVCLTLALTTRGMSADITFSDQALAAGVADEGRAHGAAFGDMDGDGWPDLLVTRLGRDEAALLYRNLQDGTFALTGSEIWEAPEGAMGTVLVDLDVDGDLDIYAIVHRLDNQFYRNDGGIYSAVPLPERIGDPNEAVSAVFGDFDGDGDLDLFSAHRSISANQLFTSAYADGFADRSDLMSPLRAGNDTFGAVAFDFDSDSDLDIYVSDFAWPSLLHRNDGGGTFRQVAESVGLSHSGPSVAAFPADYDGDGDVDLYVANGLEQPNTLYNNHDGTHFENVTEQSGTGGRYSSPGAAWADFDNDGDLDLIASNVGAPPSVFANPGEASGGFADVTAGALGDSIGAVSMTGVSAADYDLDGDVDVFLSGVGEADMLLRNDTADSGRWLSVHVEASDTGHSPIGAALQLRSPDGIRQNRVFSSASSLGSQQGELLHFGLGDTVTASELIINWPSGQRQVISSIPSDLRLTVMEPSPSSDLRIRRVVAPDLAMRWASLEPEVEVENAGMTPMSAMLSLRIRHADASILYSEETPTTVLAPGDAISVVLPAWRPSLSGLYEFEFALVVDDDIEGNNTVRRFHHLHSFVDAAPALGIDDLGPGWAAAFADYDNDGDLDLYVSNGGSLGTGDNVLCRNDSSGGFTDVTQEAGVSDSGNGTGVAFADFDRDGYHDLFIAKGGFVPPGEPNRLFRNNADGTFTDRTSHYGLTDTSASYAAVVGDYDRDGNIDLYVSQFRGQTNTLYRNDGAGGLTDVTREKEIQSFFRFSGAAAAFADYDNDGDVDLYASMFGDFDRFYADTGSLGYSVASVGDRGEAVGIAVGDIDADADLDIYIANQSGRSALFENDLQNLSFVDIAAESGTENLALGTGCAFADYDADGDLDLLVVNAHSANRVYANLGDGTFLDVATAFGMADTVRSRAVIVGDYDNDGDEDVYVVNEGKANRLFQNGGSGNGWLKVSLRGVQSNTDGIGARIEIDGETGAQMREVNGTAGLSYSSRVAHFGLGTSDGVEDLTVRWPSGVVDAYHGIDINTSIHIVEGARAITAIEESADEEEMPGEFALENNFPNPFNPATSIGYSVSQAAHVHLAIYNALGQQVKVLVDEEVAVGRRSVRWDGRDDGGRPLASGVYWSRLRAGGSAVTRSMVMLR